MLNETWGKKKKVKKKRDEGFVYFIRVGDYGPIKIGWSTNPMRRLKDLRTGSYDNVNIFNMIGYCKGSQSQEKALHAKLWRHKRSGNIGKEWFDPSPEVLETIGLILLEGNLLGS